MTRHVGSRASCYPPDSVSFRRFAGALRRLRPSARACGHTRAGRPCPAARGGSPREIPGVGRVCQQQAARYGERYRDMTGKQRRRARPSNRALRKANVLNGRSSRRSAAEKSLDRGRSSETIFNRGDHRRRSALAVPRRPTCRVVNVQNLDGLDSASSV